MNKTLVAFLFLVLVGCAQKPVTKVSSASRPAWIDAPKEHCPKGHLCSVGTGTSLGLAKASATADLAQMFEQRIKVEFSSELSNRDGKDSEFSQESINSATDIMLSGVEHPEAYEGSNEYYALGTLRKSKAGRVYKKQIDKLDEEIKNLLKEKRTGALFLIEEKLRQREVLSKRYSFLTNFELSPPLTISQLAQKKRRAVKGVVVHVLFEEEAPKALQPYVGNLLASIGYAITKGKNWNPKSTHLLSGKLRTEKVPMKVKGFEKYKFILTLDAQNRAGVKSGSVNVAHEEVGRNFAQSKNKALAFFKEKIKEKLSDISFEIN